MLRREHYLTSTLGIASLLSLLLLIFPLSLFSQDSSPASSDFNGDGVVDTLDFLLFVDVFGSKKGEATYDAKYDLDGNGEIGIPDFLIFVDNFGQIVNSDNEESTSGGSGGSSGSSGSSGSGNSGSSGNSGNSGGSSGGSGGTSPSSPQQQEVPLPQVTISAGATSVTEGTDVTFTITTFPPPTTLWLSGCIIDETGDVLSDDEAEIGPSTLTNYETLETTTPVTIKTIDDDVDEPDSVVTVSVQWEDKKTGNRVGSLFSASVTVKDNDPP